MLWELTANQQTVISCLLRASKKAGWDSAGCPVGTGFLSLSHRAPPDCWVSTQGPRGLGSSPQPPPCLSLAPRAHKFGPGAETAWALLLRAGEAGPASRTLGAPPILSPARILPENLQGAPFSLEMGQVLVCLFFSFTHRSSRPLPSSRLSAVSYSFIEEPLESSFSKLSF